MLILIVGIVLWHFNAEKDSRPARAHTKNLILRKGLTRMGGGQPYVNYGSCSLSGRFFSTLRKHLKEHTWLMVGPAKGWGLVDHYPLKKFFLRKRNVMKCKSWQQFYLTLSTIRSRAGRGNIAFAFLTPGWHDRRF